ncbi:MAG: Imidazole glycerol phosphate synthase subunit HisH [Clostridia bacterium 41_269]|nr:MAG: Imidazole glycerol phosphate synthase subunit HisH [Clostridia bacterium 41_269]
MAVVIIDYGMGNLLSVQKAFLSMGIKAEISNDPRKIVKAKGIVLPGVGAFSDAMKNLKEVGADEAIKEAVFEGVPFLGICLGLQLIFSVSFEDGEHKGLDLIPGEVKRLPSSVKVPHMGWNQIKIRKNRECAIFKGIEDESFFYFVHSFYVNPLNEDVVAATTEYGIEFCSAVCRENIFGVQFHPEKSSALGLKVLKNFGELVEKC